MFKNAIVAGVLASVFWGAVVGIEDVPMPFKSQFNAGASYRLEGFEDPTPDNTVFVKRENPCSPAAQNFMQPHARGLTPATIKPDCPGAFIAQV